MLDGDSWRCSLERELQLLHREQVARRQDIAQCALLGSVLMLGTGCSLHCCGSIVGMVSKELERRDGIINVFKLGGVVGASTEGDWKEEAQEDLDGHLV